ncbi:MAG: polyprenyl synthetase family protein [Actinobacteria bacterium]|nr:polyprenyl synthetase family protein [Acidimicrobiaceae bacterium]MBP6488714.1 polyprenyl synthetase family protein [Ilumatobacteraceae bacterium]NMD23086.1 polyprenyl synthetase family protein [Actinomycetota bacterium]MBP7888507.1 polyprenyl synthetase family protein [Ilumatobacteraceae bacterium]MBP8210773.1 polyprenyl synthetase family protein [Ilumatobacteraceae bacterium]
MSSPAAPPSLAAIAARVEQRLREFLAPEHARWAAFDADLAEPMAEIGRLVLVGGKRLRPAFCHWGFAAAGGDPADEMVANAGAAFELMHAFALFHDDVMDDAASRRGNPTTHTVFAQHHRDGAWAGEARRFGEGVAILVGDLAFVYSDMLMAGAGREAWAIWNELRIELNVGQVLDIIGSVRNERSRHKAEQICRYKSGKYTIERPLHLGAVMAAPERAAQLLPALSAYGLPLGDAFQMRDDVMGAFGDAAVTGKPVGGDLREGKPTPLMARAVAAADAAQQQVLALVGRADLTDDDVARVQQAIIDSGALADLEATITRLTAEAVAAIERAPIEPGARDELIALATYVSQRTV